MGLNVNILLLILAVSPTAIFLTKYQIARLDILPCVVVSAVLLLAGSALEDQLNISNPTGDLPSVSNIFNKGEGWTLPGNNMVWIGSAVVKSIRIMIQLAAMSFLLSENRARRLFRLTCSEFADGKDGDEVSSNIKDKSDEHLKKKRKPFWAYVFHSQAVKQHQRAYIVLGVSWHVAEICLFHLSPLIWQLRQNHDPSFPEQFVGDSFAISVTCLQWILLAHCSDVLVVEPLKQQRINKKGGASSTISIFLKWVLPWWFVLAVLICASLKFKEMFVDQARMFPQEFGLVATPVFISLVSWGLVLQHRKR